MDSSVLGEAARYDSVAEWYLSWTEGGSAGFVCDPEVGFMAERLPNQRWLDVACGTGRTSRELARRGAEVLGVDLSSPMIAAAEVEQSGEGLRMTYRAADITRPEKWWDGRAFDGAVCEMAFMDIDDLDGTLAAVAHVVRPSGRFLVSLVHPCCPTTEAGLSSWPPEHGYHAEGFWTSPGYNRAGVHIRVGSNHRTLTTYLNALLDAGFELERVHEPKALVPMWLLLSLGRR